MAANFESSRYHRRYRVNESGFAEFDWDQSLRRFIPWYEVTKVEFNQKSGLFSIASSSGRTLVPKLDRSKMTECHSAVRREWHVRAPLAFREQYARQYRGGRQALLLGYPVIALIPGLLVYSVLWVNLRSGLVVDWTEVTKINRVMLMSVSCLALLWLAYFKFLRQDFEQYYAEIEAVLVLEAETERRATLTGRAPDRQKFSFGGLARRFANRSHSIRQCSRQFIQRWANEARRPAR